MIQRTQKVYTIVRKMSPNPSQFEIDPQIDFKMDFQKSKKIDPSWTFQPGLILLLTYFLLTLRGSKAEKGSKSIARVVNLGKGRDPGKGLGGREILPRGIETRGCPKTTSAQRAGVIHE